MAGNDDQKTPFIDGETRHHEHHHHVYKLYKRRWFVLAVVAMFNLSNAMIWISFAPVTNYTAQYFRISEKAVNYFSLVYFIASLPFGGISWWTIETYGFRFSVILGCVLNAVGAILRVVGAYSIHNHNKYYVVLIGQIVAACVQPFVLSMPTKIAALWFSDHERTKANTIATMANPLGVLIANGIAAGMVTGESDIGPMLIVMAVPAVLTALMAIVGIWSSKPPTPPAASALIEPVSFFLGIKTVLKNKPFMLLAICCGVGIAAFSSISTIVQQLICPMGYDDVAAGIIGALIIVGGFIGAGLTGIYVDKTRDYIHIAKLFCCLFGLVSAISLVAINLRNMSAFLYIIFALYGFFALGVLPIFLELGVECTYPVDEATSSGIQWMFGQVFGAIILTVGLAVSPELTADEIQNSCNKNSHNTLEPLNFSIYAVVVVLMSCFVGIFFLIFFKTEYKRLNAEHQIDDEDTSSDEDSAPENVRSSPSVI